MRLPTTAEILAEQARIAANVPAVRHFDALTGRPLELSPTGELMTLPPGVREQKIITVTLPASGGAGFPSSYSQVVEGDFFLIRSITFAGAITGSLPITAKPSSSGVAVPISLPGTFHKYPNPFSSVEFSNPENTICVVVLLIGFGDARDPIIFTGPVQTEITATVTVASTGAYVIGDCVGTATPVISGAFLPGCTHALLTRAKLSKKNPSISNANFRLEMWNGNGNAINTGIDKVAYPIEWQFDAYRQSPLEFAPFVAGTGASDYSVCDLEGIPIRLFKAKTAMPTTPQNEPALYWKLIAQAPYVSINPEEFILFLSLEQYP